MTLNSFETDLVVGAGLDQRPRNEAMGADEYGILVDYGRQSSSGQRVNHRNATSLSAVWQAVTQIAGSLSTAPLQLHERDGDNERIAVGDPINYALSQQPNPEMQAVKFWRRVWTYYLLWGNAYVYVSWSRQGGQQRPTLYPLLPDRTSAWIDYEGGGLLYYVTEINIGNPRLEVLTPEEVLHLEWFPDATGLQGRDVTREARDAWGLALSRSGFASKFFKHGGRAGGTLVVDAATPKKALNETQEKFRRAYENPDDWFRTVVMRDGSKFHADTQTLEQSQMVESSRESVKDVARYFNLAPSRLGEEGGTSYGSKAEDNRAYLDQTLAPHMGYAEKECESKLLTEDVRRSGDKWIAYDVDQIIREGRSARYTSHEVGIRARFLTPNEARRIEGMNPLPGGDDLQNPAIDPAGTADSQDAEQAVADVVVDRCLAAWKAGKRHRSRLKNNQTRVERAAECRAIIFDSIRPSVAAYCATFAAGVDVDHITQSLTAELMSASLTDGPDPAILIEVLRNGDSISGS